MELPRIALPVVALPDETMTPAVLLPEMMFPALIAVPPTVTPEVVARKTAAPLPLIVVVPAALTPIRLPWIVPVEPTSNKIPALRLPLTTFPAPTAVPPKVALVMLEVTLIP